MTSGTLHMMTTKDHVRMGWTLVNRLLQVLLIFPSALVGTLIIAIGFTGGDPIRDSVAAVYEWADGAFRTAPPGYLLAVAVGPRQTTLAIQDRPLRVSQNAPLTKRPVAIQHAIDETAASLTACYQVLVVLSGAMLLAVLGPRRFLGLPQPSTTPTTPA